MAIVGFNTPHHQTPLVSSDEENQEIYENVSKADKICMTHLKVDKLFLSFQDLKPLSHQQLTPPSIIRVQDCHQVQRKMYDTSLHVMAEPNNIPIFNSILAAPNIGTVGFQNDPYSDQMPRIHPDQELFDSLVSVAPMEVDRQDFSVPCQHQLLTLPEETLLLQDNPQYDAYCQNATFGFLPPPPHSGPKLDRSQGAKSSCRSRESYSSRTRTPEPVVVLYQPFGSLTTVYFPAIF
jgi:hypothetical protein